MFDFFDVGELPEGAPIPDVFRLVQPEWSGTKWRDGFKGKKAEKEKELGTRRTSIIAGLTQGIDRYANTSSASLLGVKSDGQAAIYAEKYAEAKAFLADKKAETPWLDEEVAALGVKKKAQAEIIVAKYEATQNARRRQEALRLASKKLVRSAKTYSDAVQAASSFIEEFDLTVQLSARADISVTKALGLI